MPSPTDFAKTKRQNVTENNPVKYKFFELTYGKEKHWSQATELLCKYVLDNLKIYTTKEDKNNEVWVYKNGIYIPHGRSEVKLVLRELLGEHYSQFVFNKVIEKIEPDTYINPRDFFLTNYVNEIPVVNGILNVETKELRQFDKDKIFFNKLPVRYNPNAECPKIESFLKDVLANEDDIKVFYELAGFGLLKEYKFEKAFMFVGDGRNGKGKSIELLKRLVGVENCCSVPIASLLPEGFFISEMFSKLFNLAGDIGNQDLKDTSMFKSLTGRDLINAHRKFNIDISFENYAKFVFACNELPMVYDLSMGFWDRWILLDFPYTFVTKEEYDKCEDKKRFKIRDDDIIKKIVSDEEMSGFLNKALEGLQRIIKDKRFSSTSGSEEVKSTWIRKSNSFIAFCYDYVESDEQEFISKKELRRLYSEYCKKHQTPSKSDYVLKRVLQETYGVVDERKNLIGNCWENVWLGIKWKKKLC